MNSLAFSFRDFSTLTHTLFAEAKVGKGETRCASWILIEILRKPPLRRLQ